MGIKDAFNQAPSPEEEALYKQVLDEVESGVMRKGIYAKALADGLGDEGKAQSLYIKYRVQSLVDEQKGKAEQLGIELAEKERHRKETEKAQKARDKAKAKRMADNEWKYNTPWYVKFVIFPIVWVVCMVLIFMLLLALGVIG